MLDDELKFSVNMKRICSKVGMKTGVLIVGCGASSTGTKI